MIVVVPEAHALPPEATPVTSPNSAKNVTPYLTKNQQVVDEELFHDIIPFIKARFTISDEPRERAIAGLSMGGLQAIETGIVACSSGGLLLKPFLNKYSGADFYTTVYRREPLTHPPPSPIALERIAQRANRTQAGSLCYIKPSRRGFNPAG